MNDVLRYVLHTFTKEKRYLIKCLDATMYYIKFHLMDPFIGFQLIELLNKMITVNLNLVT